MLAATDTPPPLQKPHTFNEAAKKSIIIHRAFLNPYEGEVFAEHTEAEHKTFGTPARQKRYKKAKKPAHSVEQRSGKKRLYDHNIFLRALFTGDLVSPPYGNLVDQFQDAVFLDLGSAILSGEGAVTVRDVYEDDTLREHLTIVASDINERTNIKTSYIDIYRKSKKQLPFPVIEIPVLLDQKSQFRRAIRPFLKETTNGIILRSANAGPDLYYTPREIQRHLRAAIAAFYRHNLLYFFNKFILYKPVETTSFIILGEIDAEVGINHREAPWEDIDWAERRFRDAIRLNPQVAEYLGEVSSHSAETGDQR